MVGFSGHVLGYCGKRMNRQEFIQRAATEEFDVCIIGGGASGAGCALDAQARGLKTILLEKVDFGAATSSKSTKLVHGGVRYLEQAFKKLSWGQYKMVRKALRERTNILKIAPHLARPLQLITPCRTWIESIYYFIGLKLYDWISGKANIGNSRLLNKQQALALMPNLRKSQLFNAVSYYDGQMDDQRLNMALIQTAVEKGAICINHCSAENFIRNSEGKLQSVQVIDRLTGIALNIRSKLFINATGPYSDNIRQLANPKLVSRIRVSKGVHLVLPASMLPSSSALLIPKTKDGRLVFAIPYQHRLLVGTTDDETQLTDKEFGPTAQEVDYLLEYTNEYLDVHATPGDVMAGFGGLRPLITSDGSTKDLVRDHEVEVDESSGLVSILGGKWTTYRLMARDTVDEVERKLRPGVDPSNPLTERIGLLGSQQFDSDRLKKTLQLRGIENDIATHLVEKFGSQCLIIAEKYADEEDRSRLMDGLPYIRGEIYYVIDYEMACTVQDVLDRRFGVQLIDWQQTMNLIPIVGDIMQKRLQWTIAEKLEYVDRYQQQLQEMMAQIHRKD